VRFKYSSKSSIGPDAPSVVGFAWLIRALDAGRDVSSLALITHEGRCGRCGRLLTVPASVACGIGPECAGKMGFDLSGFAEHADVAAVLDPMTYCFAGSARFTVTSRKTGTRFTYHVRRAKGEDESRPWFARVLTGSDNENDYEFFGTVFPK